MLGLTLVCAVAASVVASWRLPEAWTAALVLLAMAAAAYLVLRFPYVCRELVRLFSEWTRLRRRRAELNAQAIAEKNALKAAKSQVSTTDSSGQG